MEDADKAERIKKYNVELNKLLGYQDKPFDFTPLGEQAIVGMIIEELKAKKGVEPALIRVTIESSNIQVSNLLGSLLEALLMSQNEMSSLKTQQKQEAFQAKCGGVTAKPASEEELRKLVDGEKEVSDGSEKV